jgi:exodeoxyribonuclease-5
MIETEAALPACPHAAFSPDQCAAWSAVAALLARRGIDLAGGVGDACGRTQPLAVLGRAGSGKTHLLATLVQDMGRAGVAPFEPGEEAEGRRTVAVLTPTNKAASVLRSRGIPATTLHRVIYRPVFHDEYQTLLDWLAGGEGIPTLVDPETLRRAKRWYETHGSLVGALAAVGLKGADFITGWARRETPLDVAFVDEGSMLSEDQLRDLAELFPSLVLFGDPAQLAPVKGGAMVLESLPAPAVVRLSRVHRQAGDSPILDLAHALAEPSLSVSAFEDEVIAAARRDERVVVTPRVDTDLMARTPVLVWRNQTRLALIGAFRSAHGAPEDALLPGEPLVCDGLEYPQKDQKQRFALEARGLIRGAQVIYLGPSRRADFARLHIVGAEEPNIRCRAIVTVERAGEGGPSMPFAARRGAVFVHGAALTIHKAQGSQWREVQVFAPDLKAAARSGLVEAGLPLWRRLAYVALTRAEERVRWVVDRRLARPTRPLGVDDLAGAGRGEGD